jgi:hypothetical protein
MTTYKEIFGKYVKNYSSDPTSDIEGQIWYNSTSGTFKSNVSIGGAWSSGGNLTTLRNFGGAAGTLTAGLAFGGETPPGLPGAESNSTEEYDGTSWSPGGNLGTARFGFQYGSIGTQTSSLGAGGFVNATGYTSATEEYDGTSWSPGGSLNTARYETAGGGTQTAAFIAGGAKAPGTTITNETEKYDGSAWTTSGNLSTSRFSVAGTGTQTAGLAIIGRTQNSPATFTNSTEEYNGSTWTAGGNFPSPGSALGSAGTQTDTIAFGGGPSLSPRVRTFAYDGTSWSILPATMGTARYSKGGGNSSAAFATFPQITEEYINPTIVTRTITTS